MTKGKTNLLAVNRDQFNRMYQRLYPKDSAEVLLGMWESFVRASPHDIGLYAVDADGNPLNGKTPEGAEALWGEDSL